MNNLNFRILLERRRGEIESILAESEPHNALKNNFLQRLDRLKKQKAEKQLKSVVEALQRIEDGSFGECKACGKAMSNQELLIFPERNICSICSSDTKSSQMSLS